MICVNFGVTGVNGSHLARCGAFSSEKARKPGGEDPKNQENQELLRGEWSR